MLVFLNFLFILMRATSCNTLVHYLRLLEFYLVNVFKKTFQNKNNILNIFHLVIFAFEKRLAISYVFGTLNINNYFICAISSLFF